MFGFKRLPKPQKPGKTVKREKSAEHVYVVGEKVCFSLSDPKTRETVWHMGEIVTILPDVDSKGRPTKAEAIPFELVERSLKIRAVEDWETSAPPYFPVPSEVLILDRLLSQLEWSDRKLSIKVEIDLGKTCVAKHVPFLNLLSPKKDSWDQLSYKHRWGG